MAGTELIPPQLPKLPEALPTPYDPALQSIIVALREYMELRRGYQRAAKTLVDHDAEVRQQERLQRKLAERQVSLTERVKRRLVREYSARANNPGSPDETTAELAQRLLTERHSRQSTQAGATPQTRSRFSVMSMIPGTVRASRLSRAQPRSEHAFASLLDTRRTAAETDGRLNELNRRSGSLLASTQRSFSNAADAFANIEAALNDIDRTLPDLSNTDRRILRKLDGLVASARIGVAAGQDVIEAHRRAQRDGRTLTMSSRRSSARAAAPEPTVLPELNELQYLSVRESMPVFMQMPTPAQCMAAAVNVTPQISLTPDANIAKGTPRQRVDGLMNSLAGYHENVSVLRQHLRENVLAIQAYAAQPGEDTMSVVENSRLSLETHLYSVRDAVGDVSKRCDDLRQVQDPQTLGFALRVAETTGRIDATLEREIERNRTNELDVRTFDERFRETPEQQQQREHRELRELRRAEETIRPDLRGLLYAGVRDAMPLLREMPTAAQWTAASADDTAGLAQALNVYQQSVSRLGQHLQQNTSSLQAYAEAAEHAAGMGAAAALEQHQLDGTVVENTRSEVDRRLEDVHAAFEDVRTSLQSFERSAGAESLDLTQRTRAAVDAIGPRIERELTQQQRARAPDRHIRELQYPEVTTAMPLFKLMPGKQACLAGTNQIAERTLLKPDASNKDRTPPQRVERLADALEGYATQVQILESRLSGNEAATRIYGDRPRRSTLVAVMNSRLDVERQLKAVSDACKHVRREWRAFKQIDGTESMQFTQRMRQVLGQIDFQLDREVDREVNRNNPGRLDLQKFDDEFRKQREHRQEQRDAPTTPRASRIARASRGPSGLRNEIVEHQGELVVARAKPTRR